MYLNFYLSAFRIFNRIFSAFWICGFFSKDKCLCLQMKISAELYNDESHLFPDPLEDFYKQFYPDKRWNQYYEHVEYPHQDLCEHNNRDSY